MRPFLAAFLALLAFQATAQIRTVQLLLSSKDNYAPQRLTVATNEMVTVVGIGWSSTQDGVNVKRITPSGSLEWANVTTGEIFVGEAEYVLDSYTDRRNGKYYWAIFRIETVNSTGVRPETVLVLPAGSGASVILEGSGNLFDWSPLLSTNLPTVGTNQFFRIRLAEGPDETPSQPGRQAPEKN